MKGLTFTLTVQGDPTNMASVFALLATLKGVNLNVELPGEKPLSPEIDEDNLVDDDADEAADAAPAPAPAPVARRKPGRPAGAKDKSPRDTTNTNGARYRDAAAAAGVPASAPASTLLPKTPEPAPEVSAAPAAPAATKWTAESIRDLMMACIKVTGPNPVMDHLKFYKATKIGNLDPAHYNEFAAKVMQSKADAEAAAMAVV